MVNHPNRSKQQQAKHTPGPWAVETPNDHQNIIVSADGETIALGVSAANAPLIAAAPELLAALDNIVANAKVIPDPAMEGTTDTYSVPLDDIEAARAILAKAYGR